MGRLSRGGGRRCGAAWAKAAQQALRNPGTQAGNAISFASHDWRGNRNGIGALITVVDTEGVTLTREVQRGGGFMSFDAPEVHFSLGTATAVVGGNIHWADGYVSSLPVPMAVGLRYQVTRR